jgi:glycosyltransferase involved in cell wall biosynthesis
VPKKILLIGMLNSVHFANWLERIADSDLEIHLFPSRQYRHLHPKIKALNKNFENISVKKLPLPHSISVYLEFLLDTKWLKFLKYLSRSARLHRLLAKNEFHRIHAIEIQNAGYLLTESLPTNGNFRNIIVTNWGSDIYYFSQFPADAKKIRDCLSHADYYSAECKRDYVLAKEHGFKGVELPVVPNSTTFKSDFFQKDLILARSRNQIILKCYGGTFGFGDLLLTVATHLLSKYEEFSIYAYSITPELLVQVELLRDQYPTRFRFSTVEEPVSHEKIIEEFGKSRVYVGASRSDGISTSFLEALASGAFPIQTSTSCAAEWIDSGARGAIVTPSIEEIESKLDEVLNDVVSLEEAQKQNALIAKSRLSFETISGITRTFYA